MGVVDGEVGVGCEGRGGEGREGRGGCVMVLQTGRWVSTNVVH